MIVLPCLPSKPLGAEAPSYSSADACLLLHAQIDWRRSFYCTRSERIASIPDDGNPYSIPCCGFWKLQFAGEAEEQVTVDTADASADAAPTATPTPSDTDPPDDAASSGETRPNSTKGRAVCHVLNADQQLSGPVQF